MQISLTAKDYMDYMRKAHERLCENKDYITELDAATGDGDHFANLNMGFQKVNSLSEEIEVLSIDKALQKIGMLMMSSVGGSGGILYGSAYLKASQSLSGKTVLDLNGIGVLLSSLAEGIMERGKCAPGMKTMVDAIMPAAKCYNKCLESKVSVKELLEKTRHAALDGANGTKDMEAVKGRACYQTGKGVGHIDPGAVTMAFQIAALMDQIEDLMKMKIIVLDGYTENPGDLTWEALEELGELVVYDRTSYVEDSIISERIGDADIVITNKTPISQATIDACPNIKLIAVLATGYNVIDCGYAGSKGIPVVNVPSYGTAAVSQYSIALLLEICHHIGHHSASVHSGKWESNADWCYWDYPLIELSGKTMGIIGFGRIGQAEGRIAKALGMEVIAYDCFPNDQGREIGEYVELETLYQKADVITLHCNLTKENTNMINKESIEKMKDGVILINNSRGQLINEHDVADALKSGKISAAALDVVYTEPIKGDNPLLTAPNCIITPHISWASRESRQRIMDQTVENIKAFQSGTPINVVNV